MRTDTTKGFSTVEMEEMETPQKFPFARPLPPARSVRAGGIALAVLAGAVIAARLTGTGNGGIARGVEMASSNSSSWLRTVSASLPLGYAFGAGMVAAVNPCGFAMLPAYLGFYLGDRADTPSPKPARVAERDIARALQVSVVMSAGFVLLFGAAGLVLSAATAAIAAVFPWLGLAMGVLLIGVAGWMLAGGVVFTALGERLAARAAAGAHQRTNRGFFAYGFAYGAASLSCTLPIFLAVIGGGTTAGSPGGSFAQFMLYALGMAVVITALTLGTALFQSAVTTRVRRLLPFVQPVSAVLLLTAGAYLVYYWLTLGGLLSVHA